MNIDKNLSNGLYFLRWFSAFLVVIDHLRTEFFDGLSNQQITNMIVKLFYFITFLGHNAVIIFFVLSGFFVGGGLLSKINNSKFDLINYLVKRFTRLYVVLIPILIFSFILYLFNPSLYKNTDLITFLGNVFFLQTIYMEEYASNTPLWSLAYEGWFYILFIFITYLFLRKKLLFNILLFVFCIILLSPNLNILLYLNLWLLGVLVYVYNNKILSLRHSLLLFLLVFFITRILSLKYLSLEINQFILDLFLSFSLVLLINSMKYEKFLPENTFFLNKKLADFSYTLYLIHVPLLITIFQFLGKDHQITYVSLIAFVLILVFIYFSAWLFSIFTENKTNKIYNLIVSKIFFKKEFKVGSK